MTIKNNKTEMADKEVIKDDESLFDENINTSVDSDKPDSADNLSCNGCNNDDKETSLADELNEYKDKYLRLGAEFDNYRKRTLKEKMDLIQNAGADVIKSMLTVLDDFDRAENAMDKVADVVAVKQGTLLIHQKFVDTLKQKGLKEIDTMGKEFDTDFCEAIVKLPVPEEDKKGKVVDVIEKGYMLNDKVLRFAKVVVGE